MRLHLHPLETQILFHLGPVPISQSVVTTWGIMAALVLLSWLAMRNAKPEGGGFLQSIAEITVETVADQLKDIMQADPWRYVPLIGTLFIYLVVANLCSLLPDVISPTAHIETPAALALIVFFSVQFFGLRQHGFKGYMAMYLKPNPLLLPLNIASQVTRSFSMMVRLFGNMMSHEIIIAIVLVLAGLVVPVPFMLLGILIGIIQAFIFAVLAAVYIGAAAGASDIG